MPRGDSDAASVVDTVAAAKGSRPRQLDALTGLRFFAAFAILFAHDCQWVAPFKDDDSIARYGGVTSIYGMPLFFVLSGFVIHYNYGHLFSRMRFRWAGLEFFGARFARLYPLLIAAFAVGLVVDNTYDWLLDDAHAGWWFELVAHFTTMTQSWFYIIIFNDRLLMENAYGLAWSISTEFFFYLCYMGLVFLIIQLRSLRNTIMTWMLFSALAFSLFIFMRWHLPAFVNIARNHIDHFIPTEQKWGSSFVRWFFYYSPYSRIFEFILGCLTAHLYLHIRERPVTRSEERWSHLALAAALICLFAAGVVFLSRPSFPFHGIVQFLALNFLCAVPIGVLIFCVSRYPTGISRFLCLTPLVLLGEVSYSIYSVHTWTLRIFIRDPVNFTTLGAVDAVVRIALGIGLTLVLATATYRLIEVPGRARLRRFFDRSTMALFGPRANNFRGTAPGIASCFLATGSLVVFLAACLAYQLTR